MIVSCGEALIDFMPISITADSGESVPVFRPFPGGSPFNVAIGIGRLGAPVGFLGRVSTDFFGDLLMETLSRNGVEPRYVKRTPDPSTLAFVSSPTEGEPQYAFYAKGTADRLIVPSDLPDVLGNEVDCLHLSLGAISLLVEPAAGTYEALLRRESGKRLIAFDPNIRPNLIPNQKDYARRLERWVSLCDLVKVSRADLDWLYPGLDPEDAAEAWRKLGPKLVVVTLGADGALALTRSHRVTVPGRKVKVADTVGAGDSFHAALLAGLHDGGLLKPALLAALSVEALRKLLERAVAAAAITCSRPGPNPPTKAELEATL
jgi:fructokinase